MMEIETRTISFYGCPCNEIVWLVSCLRPPPNHTDITNRHQKLVELALLSFSPVDNARAAYEQLKAYEQFHDYLKAYLEEYQKVNQVKLVINTVGNSSIPAFNRVLMIIDTSTGV